MTARPALTIPVTVRLGSPAAPIVSGAHQYALEKRLRTAVAAVAEEIGVPGRPQVTIECLDSPDVVRVRVHGAAHPLGGALLWRVWNAVAAPDLSHLPASGTSAERSDTWLTHFLASEPDREIVFGYVEQLVVRGILNHPSSLLTPDHAAAYARRRGRVSLRPSLAPEQLARVLGFLLDAGVSVADHSRVLDVVAEACRRGLSLEDTKEVAFDRLRSRRIEILAKPEYLAALLGRAVGRNAIPVEALGTSGTLAVDFATMRDTLFADLGIRLPSVVWMPAPSIPEGAFAVKIGDRVESPIPGLRPGELFVNAPVDWLEGVGAAGRRALNPVTGMEGAIIDAASSEDAVAQLETYWTPVGLIVFVLYNDVIRLADRLIGLDEVEYECARLEDVFPELVGTVLSRFSLAELTRILRGLVREGVPIRDLKRICDRLLKYETVTIDETKYEVLDDRLAVAEGTGSPGGPGWCEELEFVRAGLGYYLTQRLATDGPLTFFEVERSLETRAAAAAGVGRVAPPADEWLSADEQHEFRQQARKRVGDRAAAVVTTTVGRRAFRELLALELPHVPVLARAEISRDVTTRRVGEIGMP